MNFTDNELHTITTALYNAADMYIQCAREAQKLADQGFGGHERTIAQFNEQAREARALAERIEE